MSTIILAIILGIGATIVMDIWSLILKLFKMPTLGMSMVGRWVGYLFKGRFFHDPIMKSDAIYGENALGWAAHYGIGIVFSFIFIYFVGDSWFAQPTFWPAYIWGVITVAAPYFMMQPGFGLGVMGYKTPYPNKVRLMSFLAHSAFGLGLYLTGLVISEII